MADQIYLMAERHSLPTYAQGALWLTTVDDAQPVNGERGAIHIDLPDRIVTLRWQGQDGAALLSLDWRNHPMPGWDGTVRVGGYADALHLCTVPNTGEYVHMLYLGGQPLRYTTSSLTRAHHHLHTLGRSPNFHNRMELDIAETVTTWLIPYGSPLAEQVYAAMIHNSRMHLFGRLAEENHDYVDYFSMPLILEALTVFPS